LLSYNNPELRAATYSESGISDMILGLGNPKNPQSGIARDKVIRYMFFRTHPIWSLAIAAVLSIGSYIFFDSSESIFTHRTTFSAINEIKIAALPQEAQLTLSLIKNGGSFPFENDGVVYGNRENLLPKKPSGHYSEYTVITHGESAKGSRRIVAGGDPKTSNEYYYSDDHQQSFKRILK
jgi:ribonuclease T1